MLSHALSPSKYLEWGHLSGGYKRRVWREQRLYHPGNLNNFVKEGYPTNISPLTFLNEQGIDSSVFDSLYIKSNNLLCIY